MFNMDIRHQSSPRGITLCAAPSRSYDLFKQIIMHALQCPHYAYVHLLFCFDVDLHLTCSQCHGL